MRVKDHFSNTSDFTNLLIRAEEKANEAWETEFIEDIQNRYYRYGVTMMLSETQAEHLERIADK